MNGHLSEHPLAELIREIGTAKNSGALRLERERVKVVVYFDAGEVVYATSNLRTHRLGEVLKKGGVLNDALIARFGGKGDQDLADALLSQGLIKRSDLDAIRAQQVSDVLRLALLWIDGQWSYDARVRLAKEMRITLDSRLLLIECARRLPGNFIAARFQSTNETLSPFADADNGISLLSAEASFLSRVTAPMSVSELKALAGLKDIEALRLAYTLALGGLLQRSDWSSAFTPSDPKAPASSGELKKAAAPPAGTSGPLKTISEDTATTKAKEERELKAMLARVNNADNHYDVLDIGRLADMAEIKRAYHSLARRFHPDKFHKSVSLKVRGDLESAFARFAQAYETLADASLRSAYDAKIGVGETAPRTSQGPSPASPRSVEKPREVPAEKKPAAQVKGESPERSHAETRFQQGLAALEQENSLLAIRCLAEAAQASPGEARYRAYYGSALTTQPQARRLAETELQTAITLDPANATYRVMLARLYRELGFARRAQTELERALALEPNNEAAHQLLRTINQK
jgi:curved DNA-binding protein CbpA